MNTIKVDLGIYPQGLAETYANFVRRILLLEDESYAPIAIRINNGEITTVFQTIDGVIEDLIQVYNTVTEAKYIGEGAPLETLVFYKREGEIYLSDYHSENIKVSENKKLLTVVGDREIEIEIFLLKSKGIRKEEYNRDFLSGLDINNAIVFDSVHSRIDSVGYNVIETENGEFSVEMTISGHGENLNSIITSSLTKAKNEMDKIISRFM